MSKHAIKMHEDPHCYSLFGFVCCLLACLFLLFFYLFIKTIKQRSCFRIDIDYDDLTRVSQERQPEYLVEKSRPEQQDSKPDQLQILKTFPSIYQRKYPHQKDSCGINSSAVSCR